MIESGHTGLVTREKQGSWNSSDDDLRRAGFNAQSHSDSILSFASDSSSSFDLVFLSQTRTCMGRLLAFRPREDEVQVANLSNTSFRLFTKLSYTRHHRSSRIASREGIFPVRRKLEKAGFHRKLTLTLLTALSIFIELNCFVSCQPRETSSKLTKRNTRGLLQDDCNAQCSASMYPYTASSGSQFCSACPLGALCSDGTCALRFANKTCASGIDPILGKWSREASDDGRFQLVSCPGGHQRVAQMHDGQRCEPCTSEQYILDPDNSICQGCPPGLICSGSDVIIPILQGSVWEPVSGQMVLRSCPFGYFPFSYLVGSVLYGQDCLPCGKGEECIKPPCKSCSPCRAGWFKDVASEDPCTPCPVDTFRMQPGASELVSCLQCPPHSSSRGNTSQTSCMCDEGFYEQHHACIECEAGEWCSHSVKHACPEHTTSRPGSSGLTNCTCKDGYAGTSGQGCTGCAEGTWCVQGSIFSCPPHTSAAELSSRRGDCRCKAGYFGPDGGPCTACSAGWYKVDVGTGECTPCPFGTYSQVEAATSDTCQPCPDNSTSVPGSSSFSACLCLAGHSGTWSECLACAAGTYKEELGTGHCVQCHANTFSGVTGADSATSCIPCPFPDSQSEAGSSSISQCLCNAGYTSDEGGRCTACEAGTFKEIVGMGPCRPCPEGQYSPASGAVSPAACFPCPDPASSSMAGSASFADCRCNASYSGPNGGTCTPCSAGTYKSQNGSAPCILCPAGSFSSSTAAESSVSCITCPDHSFGPAGSALIEECVCNAGYTGPNGGICVACEPGTFKTPNGSFPCVPCPDGSFAPLPGANSQRRCECAPGFFGDSGANCETCTEGTWCSRGQQTACPAGTTSPVGSSAETNCSCAEGYAGEAGRACSACLAGVYCQAGASVSCPEFTTSEALSGQLEDCKCMPGYTGADGGPCSACNAGWYKDTAGSGPCLPCSAAQFSTFEGSFSPSLCVDCPPNAISDPGSDSFADCLCLPGYSGTMVWGECHPCPAGTLKAETGVGDCAACSKGTYSTSSAATSNATCRACLDFSHSVAGSSSRMDCICNAGYAGPAGGPCQACASGKFLPIAPGQLSSTLSDCLTCPSSATSAVASSGVSSCKCNAGFTGPDGDNCVACAAGKFKALTGSAVCTDCPPGTYSSTERATSNLTCFWCPYAHSHSPSGSPSLQGCACNEGYHGLDGMACAACPRGTYKLTSGSSSCAKCPEGKYSPEEAASSDGTCLPCPTNAFSANASGSLEQCLCDAGYSGPDGGPCQPCAAGSFKKESGSGACLLCGEDSYSETTAATSASFCLACPGNATSPPGSSVLEHCVCRPGFSGIPGGICMLCPAGSWCEAGANHLCPAFSSSPAGSVRKEDCQCQAGYAGESGVSCSPCPPDFWCPGGNTAISCPGNTTSHARSIEVLQCSCKDGYSGAAGDACIGCRPDTWCTDGQVHHCPASTASNDRSSSQSDCKCNAGYSGPDGGPCTACLPGSFKEGKGDGVCVFCPNGTLSQVAASISQQSCQACPLSSTSDVGSSSLAHCMCKAGYTGSWSECVPCAPGTFKAAVGPGECHLCPSGTYSAVSGAQAESVCAPCPANHTHSQAGSSSKFDCLCEAGFIGTDGGPCLPCEAGKYKDVRGSSECIECGVGEDCTVPPCTACSACKPGSYKNAIGTSPCVACSPGTYRAAGTAASSCSTCPKQSTTLGRAGQTSMEDCACEIQTYIVVDGGLRTCETCPLGAVCPDGSCALHSSNGSCTLLGTWLRGNWDGFGPFELVSCPAGYQRITDLHDAQRCHPCSSQQYILDPNTDECQACPPGLKCYGNDVTSPVLNGSIWRAVGAVMLLESCPAGYQVFSRIEDAQECVPCGKGEECVAPPCVTCSPCQPGWYKDVVGSHLCWPCPADTYRERSGATEIQSCIGCPYRSTTLGFVGQTSVDSCICGERYYRVHLNDGSIQCQSCLPGATCADSSCALQNDNLLCADGTVVGEWKHGGEVVQEYNWLFVLVGCPAGYQLVNPSFDRQECLLCDRTEYIIDSNAHECQRCPVGLLCRGNHVVAPTVNGSVWTIVGEQFRLQSCPSGYYVVSGPSDGSQQQCVPCGKGQECTREVCTECSPCQPGWYKDYVAADPCKPCPHDTYRVEAGAIDLSSCLYCIPRSTTFGLVGQSSVEACICGEEFYLVVSADGERTCKTCPVGATCADRTCALRTPEQTCEGPTSEIVGSWIPLENLPFPEFALRACPSGYQRIAGVHDAQECHKCAHDEYILHPNNDTCQKCPPGLICQGDHHVVPRVDESVWIAERSQYLLKSCPAGYLTFSDTAGDPSLHGCLPCGKGEECTDPPCNVSCTPCHPGFFKDFVGADTCHPCPQNTYRERPGASDIHSCLSCPARSSTMGLEGQHNLEACLCESEYYLAIAAIDGHRICMHCPLGALCTDGSCALQGGQGNVVCEPGNGIVVGAWTRPNGSLAEFELAACPPGFQRFTTQDSSASHDLQRCVQCEIGEYIIDGNVGHRCVRCPAGALCPDGSRLEGKAEGSLWIGNMMTGEYALATCPAGYQKINSTISHDGDGRLIEVFAHDVQECRPCDETAEYIVDPNRHQCQCCPTGAACDGSSLMGLVRGSVWTADTESGLYYLTSCPQKTELINSTEGTSHGEFSYRIQMCRECKAGREYVIDPNVYSCQACPFGADCSSGFFQPKLNTSKWEINPDSGQWVLLSCPAGYAKVNMLSGKFNHEVQECRKCDVESQYIIDPNEHECQPCPPGLRCFGNAEYTPVVDGSRWFESAEAGYYILESCPTGYSIYGGPVGLFLPAEQFCQPCGRGHHCTNVSCTVCSECPPGTYKEFIGTEACRLCPESTYNPLRGSDQPSACASCPNGADTQGKVGQVDEHACRCTSSYYPLQINGSDAVACLLCPSSLRCNDTSCPFNSGSIEQVTCSSSPNSIVGEWIFDPSDGRLVVKSCPDGHMLLTLETFGHALQGCRKCETCRVEDKFCHQAEYVVDPNKFSCQQCPIGAVCNGHLLKTRGGLDGTGQVVWETDQDGRMWLQSCPPGHHLDNSTYDLQECRQCEANEFILNSADPSYECQICPPGMACLNKNAPITDQIAKASLDIDGLTLQEDYSFKEDLDIKTSILNVLGAAGTIEISQRCWMDTAECFELSSRRSLAMLERRTSAKQRLRVTVSVSSPSLSAFEVQQRMNTTQFQYSFQIEMSDRGHTVSAVVQVAELDEFATIAGNFEIREQSLVLVSCPVGYLLINSSLDEQQCLRCQPLSYSFDPLDGCYPVLGQLFCPMRDCLECAVGAQCLGGSSFEPNVNESTWGFEADELGRQVKRLRACPAGYVLVRDPLRPTFDQCLLCPPGKFSVVEAVYPQAMVSNRTEEAEGMCEFCENACVEGARCADCAGGAEVTPREGFWLLPNSNRGVRRNDNETGNVVEVYSCPTGACVEGGQCANGRDESAAICGYCREGYALSGTDCMQCGRLSDASYQYVLLGFMIPGLLVLWYYFSWRPMFHSYGDVVQITNRASSSAPVWKRMMTWQLFKAIQRCILPFYRQYEALKARIRDWVQYVLASSITDYAKIFIRFVFCPGQSLRGCTSQTAQQVVSTFETTYTIAWPSEIKQLWEVGSYLRLNLVSIPGPNCMTTNTSYKVMLRAYTIGPVVVAFLLLWPTLIMIATGAHKAQPRRYKAVNDLFWYSIMFWFFLLYPLLSIVTVQGFNCKWIGAEHLLIADLRLSCPIDDLSSEIFWMTCVSTVMYPAGIPMFFYAILRVFRIPDIVAKKRSNAILHEVVGKYKKMTSQTLTGRIASYVGGNSENKKMVDQRSKQMFKGASRIDGGEVPITGARFCEYLHEIGIRGDHEEDIDDLVKAFDADHNGQLDLEEFRRMIQKILELELAVTGLETTESITSQQLEALCRFRWSEVFEQHEEAEEGSNFTKRFKQSLLEGEGMSSQGLSAPSGKKKTLNTFSRRLRHVDASFKLRHRHHHHHQQLSTATLASEEDEARHTCPVPPSGSREAKLKWLLGKGEEMVFRGILALPVLRWDGETEEEQLVIDRIGFLFDAYEMDYWYYELIEMARKFAMSGLIVFIRPGSPQQIAAAFIISVSTLFYFVKSSPFVSSMIDNLQTISLASQAITLFYGLMLSIQSLQGSNEAVSNTDETTMKWIILFLNLFIFILPPLSIIYEQRDALLGKLKACWARNCPAEEDQMNPAQVAEDHSLAVPFPSRSESNGGLAPFPTTSEATWEIEIEDQKRMHHGSGPSNAAMMTNMLRPPPEVANSITPYGKITDTPGSNGSPFPQPWQHNNGSGTGQLSQITDEQPGQQLSTALMAHNRSERSLTEMSDTSLDSVPLMVNTSKLSGAAAAAMSAAAQDHDLSLGEATNTQTLRTRVLPPLKLSALAKTSSNGSGLALVDIMAEVTDTGAQYQTPSALSRHGLAASLAPHRIEPPSTRTEPTLPSESPSSWNPRRQHREPDRMEPGRLKANRLEPFDQRVGMSSKRQSPFQAPPQLGGPALRPYEEPGVGDASEIQVGHYGEESDEDYVHENEDRGVEAEDEEYEEEEEGKSEYGDDGEWASDVDYDRYDEGEGGSDVDYDRYVDPSNTPSLLVPELTGHA